MASDIRVFVRWKEQTVFAGEDVECTITFKNIANEHPPPTPSRLVRRSSRQASISGKSAHYAQGRSPVIANNHRLPIRHPSGKAHRPSASLSAAVSPGIDTRSPSWNSLRSNGSGPGHKHQRSVSIVSLASDDTAGSETGLQKDIAPPVQPRGHNRAASLQILPRRLEGGASGPSPITRHASHFDVPGRLRADASLAASGRRSAGPASPLASPPVSQSVSRRSTPLSSSFKFPATAAPNEQEALDPGDTTKTNKHRQMKRRSREPSPRIPNDQLEVSGQLAPVTRVLSGTSMNGSTRSSAEFYAVSNNSSETMASEYTGYFANSTQRPPAHGRQQSNYSPAISHGSRTLLMGYAQINASFTVDGALIDQSPFEVVKRKGVLGGQGGGGVVGVEKSRSSGGFFGAFGLNNIGESLSGLLNPGELSSIKEMRGVAASKAIPLLSTPQSLLFVDLRLSPGDEKSFKFSFNLPRGLPASHKGKAIKISYNLIIGTQMATIGTSSQQQVRRVNVPFRVFSGVNDDGEILGHDLMSPYVILQDDARVEAVKESQNASRRNGNGKNREASTREFLDNVDMILDRKQRRQSSSAMMTPLEAFANQESGQNRPTSKDVINLAILRSNQAISGNRSSNRFEIARNGRRVGVIVLNRPCHRLGETVTASIDFTDAEIPCFSLRCTMETSEKVNPALALRSSASISRVTRRIHASLSENALFATRIMFSPTIPVTASPTVLTSGVSLEWELRFEFATTRVKGDAEEGDAPASLGVLEKIGQDDRGTVLAALETLQSETFEVSIPITVYGQVVREPAVEELVGLEI